MQHLSTAQVIAVRDASAELIGARRVGIRESARARFQDATAELNRRSPPLPDARAARICRDHGVALADFRAGLEQARRHHGLPGHVGHWPCDERGFYDAERHFVGLLEQELHAAEADDRAHADFARDAYGED